MRNSSLVKWSCAENVTGLKHITEAADVVLRFQLAAVSRGRGRRADGWWLKAESWMVGERCVGETRQTGRPAAAHTSENVGMSSESDVRTIVAGSLRFPTEG